MQFRGWQAFSVKVYMVNILGFVVYEVSATVAQKYPQT